MPLVDLVMPKLGESIMEATILKWYKQVGDTINLDETLLDIATDKVDSEVPSTVAGVIKEILFEVNAVVPIGAVIARVESSAVTTRSTQVESVKIEEVKIIEEVPFTPTATTIPTPSSIASPKTIQTAPVQENLASNNIAAEDAKFYSPLVLNIAQSEGVSLNELQFINGTGGQGRVTKKDILNYIAAKKAGTLTPITNTTSSATNNTNSQSIPVVPTQTSTPSKPLNELLSDHTHFMAQNSSAKIANPADVILSGNTEIVEMDRMRKLIAKHMVDSVQTSPHVTSFVEADVTNMVVWRDKVKQLFEKREGTKLTYTPMFLECIAAALEQFPLVNSSLQNDQIVYKKDINIGMA
ncbi:MAG: hypothetical protein RIR55_250, partial [Bacteroidota bacterium]